MGWRCDFPNVSPEVFCGQLAGQSMESLDMTWCFGSGMFLFGNRTKQAKDCGEKAENWEEEAKAETTADSLRE
jgi:hypothetical protein